jgi:DNA ligase D-like protein (predicted polymerase)
VLSELLDGRQSERIRFSESFEVTPSQMLEAACRLGLEGLVLKRADSPYVSARTETWLKLKCQQRQEFVVVGFTDRAGAKSEVGGLLLGYHEDGKLRYAGSVGTGWNTATGRDLHAQLVKLEVDKPALDAGTVKPGRWSKRVAGSERWTKPKMVVEVAFSEWTPDGHVRHPTFRGVRTDKPVKQISRESAAALVAAAQMNVVEFHTWNSTVKRIDQPDRVIFDLDPGKGVTWPQLQEAAVLTRALLTELGLQSWLKTSGGKGLHVVVPLAPKLGYEVVKGFSQAVVQHMARIIPQRFVAKSGEANRVGKIFIDYLRNGHGQTTAAAFSARARPGMGVSMPVSWEQLKSLGGSQWTIATAREYLSFQKDDPWADYWKSKQTLAGAMKTLGPKTWKGS